MVIRNSLVTEFCAIAALLVTASVNETLALDTIQHCNAVQNKVGFIRSPLGTIGAWSTASGEIADIITRVPRIYPCVNSVVVRPPKEEWRASVTGDPSMLTINYLTNKPSGASTLTVTVSPHVTVLKTIFPAAAQRHYLVFDFASANVDNWARLGKWTERTITAIDARSLQATVGEPGKPKAYYRLRFSEPCLSSGTITDEGKVGDAAKTVTGVKPGMYAQFEAPMVTVAVAVSFRSLEQAGQFLDSEFTDFDAVQRSCHATWKRVLDRVEIEGPEPTTRMAYTALYTVYANIIDGTDGSCYSKYYPHPRSIASSAYWQFIGGYQSCCWDNIRATYPVLMLAYPEVMSDVVNTYLARYERDGCLDGDICLITCSLGHKNIRFSPLLIAQAFESGIEAPYARLYAALKDNFSNPGLTPESLSTVGHLVQSSAGGFACSRSLEYHTGFDALALLAKANHDPGAQERFARLSRGYTNLWDNTNLAFRVKDANGAWGPMEPRKMTWNPNPQGLFEGSTKDWMFAIPHDPYGLLGLPGQTNFVERVTDYCLTDAWFNDYQLHYPFLLYYAGAPNAAQKILRNTWIRLFEQSVMYEGVKPKPPHNGWQTHYTGNSGWLLCALLGLYPVPAPAGQFIISSPAITKATIHNGKRAITIRTKNNSESNIYIRSIQVDGKAYPSYMIPARRLASGATIDLEMGSDPAQGLGELYIASTDGFLSKAELLSETRLQFVVEPGARDAITRIYCQTKPAKVLVNGVPDTRCSYDESTKTVTVQSADRAAMEVLLR